MCLIIHAHVTLMNSSLVDDLYVHRKAKVHFKFHSVRNRSNCLDMNGLNVCVCVGWYRHEGAVRARLWRFRPSVMPKATVCVLTVKHRVSSYQSAAVPAVAD